MDKKSPFLVHDGFLMDKKSPFFVHDGFLMDKKHYFFILDDIGFYQRIHPVYLSFKTFSKGSLMK